MTIEFLNKHFYVRLNKSKLLKIIISPIPLICSTSLTSTLSSKNSEQKLIIPLRIPLGKIKYIIPGRNTD